jgi:hypothetical protein
MRRFFNSIYLFVTMTSFVTLVLAAFSANETQAFAKKNNGGKKRLAEVSPKKEVKPTAPSTGAASKVKPAVSAIEYGPISPTPTTKKSSLSGSNTGTVHGPINRTVPVAPTRSSTAVMNWSSGNVARQDAKQAVASQANSTSTQTTGVGTVHPANLVLTPAWGLPGLGARIGAGWGTEAAGTTTGSAGGIGSGIGGSGTGGSGTGGSGTGGGGSGPRPAAVKTGASTVGSNSGTVRGTVTGTIQGSPTK